MNTKEREIFWMVVQGKMTGEEAERLLAVTSNREAFAWAVAAVAMAAVAGVHPLLWLAGAAHALTHTLPGLGMMLERMLAGMMGI